MDTQPKILIVDDEPFNVDYLEQELEDLDYEITSAENGLKALEQIHENPPDVILLDIMMPEMDGFEVLQRLKEDSVYRDIPVIVISALDDMRSVVKGIEWGAEDYLSKPFDPVLLKARIGACVERKTLRDREMLYLEQVEREMKLAWQVQSGLLPGKLPKLPDWQMAATLKPSRKTSGDFYDLIPLPDGQLGILIADVADKGMGAALYMVLSRTLIRTYAKEYHPDPHRVLEATNRRLLADFGAEQFVTAFYGILNPASGALIYCNAGHNPPYLLGRSEKDAIQSLDRTGMALGILEEESWDRSTILMIPGDTLVLYTDGITEAQNEQRALFDDDRLREIADSNRGKSALDFQQALLQEVHSFVGNAPQMDDITLVILARQYE
jgi:sigma-B regulation protein RsbU (phosphoserine phosphatase)